MLVMDKDTIVQALKRSWCVFRYVKIDKSERIAIGTLNDDLFTYVKKTDRKVPEHVVVYWDYVKDCFRTLKPENFIEFLEEDVDPEVVQPLYFDDEID